MAAQTRDKRDQGAAKAVYVYGIMPADVEIESGTTGVGDPPGEVRLVRSGDLAALVSDVATDRPLGRPEDLVTHEDLLDASAADVPVLPLRFGAVITSDEAVAEELLGAHHDEFMAALEQLEGHAEYVLRGRYVQDAILREVISEDQDARQLLEQIKHVGKANEMATRELRMQIGEIINNAVAVKREADTQAAGEALAGHAVASVARPPSHELDAAHIALLVENSAAADMERAVERLASDWSGRIDLRLLGPMAAYDFVGTANPATGA
jgi:hypothetical protein